MTAQRGRRRETEGIIDAVGAVETEHFGRAIMAVAAQQDLDPTQRPRLCAITRTQP